MLVVGGLGVAVVVEGVVIPSGVVEHHVLEELRAERIHQAALGHRSGDPDGPTAGLGLAAGSVSGEDLAVGIVPARVQLLERGYLRRGQATVLLRGLAEEHARIEVAARGIFDDAVLHAIERIASGQGGGLNGGQLLRRNEAVLIAEQREIIPSGVGQQVRPIVGGRAGDDAVVILGIALGFHQRLAAAVGARAEVGTLGSLAVEGVQDGLGFHGRFVNGAIAEVGDLLGVVERPGGIDSWRGAVTGVGAGAGVVVADGVGQLVVADVAGEAAVACALKLAVPVGGRHPDFELDVRVGGRLDDSGHAAERRQVGQGFAAGRREAAGRD